MKKNLKYFLKGKLSAKELRLVPSSFDLVGDILIFSDFPKGLAKKEKLIGKTVLDNYHNIKTVLKKTRKYSGKFRVPKLKIIAGEKKKEAIHKENNVLISLDVEKVYFSPRMASERKRIAQLIKPGESVLVMFSGSGVYPLVIAKNTMAGKVIGIEINPAAHKYGLENIKKNKLENKVKLFHGDVNKVLPKMRQKFDRVLMPLPKGGEDYLELAISYTKRKGFIHFYDFLNEKEFQRAKEKIEMACKKQKRRFKVLAETKCGQYSPGFYRLCVDFFVD